MPSSPLAEPGKPPEAGQWAEYLAEDGQITPCIITGVHGPFGEQRPPVRYSVTALRLKPADGRISCPHEYNGWQYDVATAQVLYDPCVPPGMQDPDAAQESDGDKDDR
ncbi:MAG TPA: hypothetical protein VJQ82_18045 [Terriglobales bacterium]|nr:hypothetical protein [Terriglobales bacterium]